ncbi:MULTISPECIES: CapA family protein [unclassified Moorena]|uniref:CapA family protein n=1 Tax=unclassified Moorena TaxID=2683338 RepID=UPI0013C6F25B|nr:MULTISPECIES: CapA family protein [unclassified Moorena]NEO18611.1 CapA family protein [Moorena sp. SIO4A5]NEP23215.1 CapA family protein [Moorena sp. SIO3I6]NEQ56429.1 CapA family protein [Moorena sp. SIO4A1]
MVLFYSGQALSLSQVEEKNYIIANFVGDVMMTRRWENTPDSFIPKYGVNAIFEPTREIFAQGDINFANLETPLSDRGTPHPSKFVKFHTKPEYVSGLTYAGINVVSLANNHTLDFSEEGLQQTIDVLNANNIKHFGSGMNLEAAAKPLLMEIHGIKIAFLGFSGITGKQPPWLYADVDRAGSMRLTSHYLEEGIKTVRDQADVVIVSIHGGKEYSSEPGSWRELEHLAIDLGADLIVSHHPHVLQGVEMYKGKLIAHSLANFVFDQPWFETLPSMILTCKIDKDGVFEAFFHPIYRADYVPKSVRGNLANSIIKEIADYSSKFSTLVLPEENIGRIILDRDSISQDNKVIQTTIPLQPTQDKYSLSTPIVLDESWLLSSVSADAKAEARFGRDLLWLSGFEESEINLWDLNGSGELYDDSVAKFGQRSLQITGMSSNSSDGQANLTSKIPVESGKNYTLLGYVQTEQNAKAKVEIQYYTHQGRRSKYYSDYSDRPLPPISSETAMALSESVPWQLFSFDFQPPENTEAVDIVCQNASTEGANNRAWFDGLMLIEWQEDFAPLPQELPTPNNLKVLQVRSHNQESLNIWLGKTTYSQRLNINYTENTGSMS